MGGAYATPRMDNTNMTDNDDYPELPDFELKVDHYKPGVTAERVATLLLFILIIVGSIATFLLVLILMNERLG